MANRFIGGMIADGLPEIAGAVPAAGGVVVEVDTALEPERGDLVACSTADDCPSAPQIARIRRVDAEAGNIGSGPSARGGGPVAGAVSGRGLRRPKPRSFQADTEPRAGPFNLKFLKP